VKSQAPGGELNPGEALELTPEKLTSNIIKLALPAVGENLLNTTVMVVEGMLVGWRAILLYLLFRRGTWKRIEV
jgi:hypothetical protein